MIALGSAMVVCGVFCVGMQTLFKRRPKKKNLWLMPAGSLMPTDDLPFSSRIYIVRCWKECTWQGHGNVWRYTLENPVTGQRCGYTTADALLKTLAGALTAGQEVEAPHALMPSTHRQAVLT